MDTGWDSQPPPPGLSTTSIGHKGSFESEHRPKSPARRTPGVGGFYWPAATAADPEEHLRRALRGLRTFFIQFRHASKYLCLRVLLLPFSYRRVNNYARYIIRSNDNRGTEHV